MDHTPSEITILLKRVASGDSAAREQAFTVLYQELRTAAENAMRKHDARPGHTLQPTALVNEMFLRLECGDLLLQARNRRHLFGIAIKAFERILLDHHRARTAQKRGGERGRIPLDDLLDSLHDNDGITIVELREALDALEELDPDSAELVRRKFYWNQTWAEIATDLELTETQVQSRWRSARAWLLEAISGGQ